mmetsp:Transcript_28679/g.61533  ORF Transcript_28679/g.61533 Transcript_28679/m.61533 type:complete len:122 (+) Transcript_28679:228-593(+)
MSSMDERGRPRACRTAIITQSNKFVTFIPKPIDHIAILDSSDLLFVVANGKIQIVSRKFSMHRDKTGLLCPFQRISKKRSRQIVDKRRSIRYETPLSALVSMARAHVWPGEACARSRYPSH